ncbi:MAG: hypothetical protein KY396_01900 [Actinobacteria bacterium]|nr:hypothetical protein [Actinomycetota bacterium]
MWKLLFLARRGWKMIPREKRRAMRKTAAKTVRQHGPNVAKGVRGVLKQARKAR